MNSLWQALEDLRGLVAVPAGWQSRLDGEFEAVRSAFLRVRPGDPARSFPCPRECGCSHRIVYHDDGTIVAVCRCDSWNCDDIRLGAEDVVLWELNWSRLGRAVAAAFGAEPKEATFGVAGAMQIGSFGSTAVPLVLVIAHERPELRSALGELAARLREPFIVLAPTSRFLDGNCKELLAGCRAGFFDLESHVEVSAQGKLHARKSSGELFGKVLPAEKEAVPEDVARQAFKLIEQLDSEEVIKPPSVLSVFRLYCVKEMTAERVARKCRCSKGTIINRLKLIREKTGMDPDELRQFSNQFEHIEDNIRESKANYVHRKRLIYDSRGSEDGE